MADSVSEAENNVINEAEINAKATSLRNELNLDGITGIYFNWTPLHAAASRGDQEVVFQRLLKSSPELADPLDSQQRTLLHFASANGYIEIVKAVITERSEMCLARDRDGANPLHIAAMRGKVDVFHELFKANPLAARARVESGERESILHICIKYNQLEFLKTLLEKYFKGKEFVNIKDNDGNTILHLAVAGRRLEIIRHILCHTGIDVNAVNASEQTAMDILLLGQKRGPILAGVDKDIQTLLKMYDAKRVQDGILDAKQIADRRNGLTVVLVLIITLIFQAGVTPPGGVWQDDKDGHKSGKAVMASNNPVLYLVFFIFNVLGFTTSLVALALIMTDWSFKSRAYLYLTGIAMGVITTSIGTAFVVSLSVVSPPLVRFKRYPVPQYIRLTFLTSAGCVISILMVILAVKIKRKKCMVKRRRLTYENNV